MGKKVYLIGFRGTGFSDDRYTQEPALVRAGHIGLAFEGAEFLILGFHPTAEASAAFDDEEAAIEWLKEGNSLPGTVQEDSAIFERAFVLAEQGARTIVWQVSIELDDSEFERVFSQIFQWYTEKTTFTYAFPSRGMDSPTDQDNCATFPRRLGLSIPEPTGQLVKYMAALEAIGQRWEPSER